MAVRKTKRWGASFILAVSITVCSILFLSVFFLSLSVWQAADSLRVIALILRDDTRSSNDMIDATILRSRGDVSVGLQQQFEEMLVRYYIEMRETLIPDRIEMLRRWGSGGAVAVLSSPSVFNAFRPSEESMSRIQERQETRTVDILSIRKEKDTGNGGVYEAQFYVYKYLKGRMEKTKYRMTLGYRYVNGYRFFSSRFVNPFGMVFVEINKSVMQ